MVILVGALVFAILVARQPVAFATPQECVTLPAIRYSPMVEAQMNDPADDDQRG